MVHYRGRCYSSSLDIGSAAIPDSLRRSSEPGPDGGQASYVRVRIDGAPRLVVGVPVATVDYPATGPLSRQHREAVVEPRVKTGESNV